MVFLLCHSGLREENPSHTNSDRQKLDMRKSFQWQWVCLYGGFGGLLSLTTAPLSCYVQSYCSIIDLCLAAVQGAHSPRCLRSYRRYVMRTPNSAAPHPSEHRAPSRRGGHPVHPVLSLLPKRRTTADRSALSKKREAASTGWSAGRSRSYPTSAVSQKLSFHFAPGATLSSSLYTPSCARLNPLVMALIGSKQMYSWPRGA